MWIHSLKSLTDALSLPETAASKSKLKTECSSPSLFCLVYTPSDRETEQQQCYYPTTANTYHPWSTCPGSDTTSCVCVCESLSCVPLSVTRGLEPTRLLHPWDIPGKSTGAGCCSLLQGSNPGFWHCRQIVYHLNHQGSPPAPITLMWISPLSTLMRSLPVYRWKNNWAVEKCINYPRSCNQSFWDRDPNWYLLRWGLTWKCMAVT